MIRHVLLTIVCAVSFHCWASELVVKNITNKTGLSNSSINVIFQDSNDIIWFGTWDGLNAYNSKDFKVYKPIIGDFQSISNTVIRNIVQESEKYLWIATDFGINRLNIREQNFERYFVDADRKRITEANSFLIAKNSQDKIFVSVYNDGIYVFNGKDNFDKITLPENFSIRKMFFDTTDRLWLLTRENQLFIIQISTDSRKVLTVMPYMGVYEGIVAVVPLKNNQFIFQTASRAVFLHKLSDKSIQKINQVPGLIRDVVVNQNEYYWGTDNGVYKSDSQMMRFTKILDNISALSLFTSSQNVVWVGTDTQGVWKIASSNDKFQAYSFENIPGLGRRAVRALLEKEANELWVGTKGDGLYVLKYESDKNKYQISKQFEATSSALLNNSVHTIVYDEERKINWIGTHGTGLNYYDFETSSLQTLQSSDHLNLPGNLSYIYGIIPDEGDVLWVATSGGGGLFKLYVDYSSSPFQVKNYKQFASSEHSSSLSNNTIMSMVKSGRYLWVTTRGGGLNRFDTVTETFDVFRHAADDPKTISNDDVLCLYKDKRGNIWVGTSLGLNKVIIDDKNNVSFQRITEEDGLSNNTIHGILQDKQDNMWVSTNNGLAKLIWTENDTYKIISYYYEDGLQDNEFSDGAYHVGPYSGKLYFGGINGFNAFLGETITQNTFMPKLWLDAFFVDNVERKITDFTGVKKNKEALIIPYQNKSFSFRFVPIDFSPKKPNAELAYMLEGFQKEWVKLGTSNTLAFTNVPPGNYTLKVRSSNREKIWSEDYYTLPLRITTPWWKTYWAFAVYALLTAIVIYFFMRIIKYQDNIRREVEKKELEKQKNEEIHQAKLSFFTNIAHEFSNSLTLIYGPSEKLLSLYADDARAKRHINTIKSSSERMQRLIRELMDFRKAETGHLKLHIEKVDVVELFTYVLDHFVEIIEQKKINFSLDFQPDSIFCNTDRASVEKIIFNLISNAVKYTPENERIEIHVTFLDDKLQFTITNTGVGIKEQLKDAIFDRFESLNQLEQQIETGLLVRNGIGLALCKSIVDVLGGEIHMHSDEKNYTTFTVVIPSNKTTDKLIPINSESGSENLFPVIELDETPDDDGHIFEEKEERKNERTLLVVDDEEEIRAMLKDYFSDKYEVIEAANGKQAYELIENKILPTLIISDIIMPEMNGIELVEKLKTDDYLKKIPIILLSTRNSVESQIEGLGIGTDAYISKPFSPRYLDAVAENLLNRSLTIMEYANSPFAGLEQYEGKTIPKEDKQLILTINKIIYDNIENENLSIDFIANELAITKIQLYRKIKEITEQTPAEYIRNIRLNESAKLIQTTSHTIQQVIYMCGFNNKAYFYREFAKKFQTTPKEYKNRSEN